jgi:hypothetical protein
MKKLLFFSLLYFISTTVSAQFTISDNHRYLLKSGKPFFWLGDTGGNYFIA